MFEQSPCSPSFQSSQTGRASPNTFWDTGGDEGGREGGRGNLTGMHHIRGGPAQKTAGKTETRESEKFEVRHSGNKGLSEPQGDQQLICLRSNTINVVKGSMRLAGQYGGIEIYSFKAFS